MREDTLTVPETDRPMAEVGPGVKVTTLVRAGDLAPEDVLIRHGRSLLVGEVYTDRADRRRGRVLVVGRRLRSNGTRGKQTICVFQASRQLEVTR